MSDRILITGVREFGYHGVLDFEKTEGQEFVVDAVIETDFSDAVASDSIDATVDYGAVGALIAATISGTRFDLIESLADRICRDIAALPRVTTVTVTVHKPRAPMTVAFGDVAVERSWP